MQTYTDVYHGIDNIYVQRTDWHGNGQIEIIIQVFSFTGAWNQTYLQLGENVESTLLEQK